jgi:hypothetical protein
LCLVCVCHLRLGYIIRSYYFSFRSAVSTDLVLSGVECSVAHSVPRDIAHPVSCIHLFVVYLKMPSVTQNIPSDSILPFIILRIC